MQLSNFSKRLTAGILAAATILQPLSFSTITIAANHPLTQITTDGPSLQTLDYVFNTDWDYDAAVERVVSGVRTNDTEATVHTLNRAYITQVIRSFARTNFTMTEGRHRIGTVYVYRNSRYGNNVDVRLLAATPGRSNANVSGLGKKGETSNNYVLDATAGNAPETVLGLGQVIAHEKGHYTYGIFDEYSGGKGESLGSPRDSDIALPTLMNDQYQFPSLSTRDQYSGNNDRTAQGRAFNSLSAWDTLASDPSKDSEFARNYERTFFSAFATNVPQTRADLKRPVDGWDAKLNIVFVPNPTDFTYVLISRSLQGRQLEAAKDAAAQAVRALPLGNTSFVAVGAYPGSTANAVVAKTALTSVVVRDKVLQDIQAITSSNQSGDFNAALLSVLDQVRAGRTGNDSPTVDVVNIATLVNGVDDNSVSVTTLSRARAERVSVQAAATTFSADTSGAGTQVMAMSRADRGVSLSALAKASGGSLVLANKPTEMVKAAMGSAKEGIGKGVAELGFDESDKLAAGASFSFSAKVATGIDENLDIAVVWEDVNDTSKLKLSLKAPDGRVMQVANVKEDQDFGNGVTYEVDLESNTALFHVATGYPGLGGQWVSTVMATSNMTGGLLQEALADSKVQMSATVIADETAQPIVRVTLGSDRAVVGAVVAAKILDAAGKLIRIIALRDDGINGDAKANDGIYSAALAGLLPAGVYELEIEAGQPATGRARFSLNGLTKNGALVEEQVIDSDFTRSLIAVVSVGGATVTVPGVSSSPAASSGGGCTVGNGTDSSLLLMLAAVALLLMRRKLIVRKR